jgi:hypothetical protein
MKRAGAPDAVPEALQYYSQEFMITANATTLPIGKHQPSLVAAITTPADRRNLRSRARFTTTIQCDRVAQIGPVFNHREQERPDAPAGLSHLTILTMSAQ